MKRRSLRRIAIRCRIPDTRKRRHHRKWPVIGHSARIMVKRGRSGCQLMRKDNGSAARAVCISARHVPGGSPMARCVFNRTACALTNGEIRRCALPAHQRRVFNALSMRASGRQSLMSAAINCDRIFPAKPNDDAVAVITRRRVIATAAPAAQTKGTKTDALALAPNA